MKRSLFTLSVLAMGLSVTALAADNINYAEDPDAATAGVVQQTRKQKRLAHRQEMKARRQAEIAQWKQDMADFNAAVHKESMAAEIIDSLGWYQAEAALKQMDFVLEADAVTFRNGTRVFVNSGTTFISVRNGRAVVQVSPSIYRSGMNGLGGVTVTGTVSNVNVNTDKKGRVSYSMNVSGIGINARVEITMYPGTDKVMGTVTPTFNANSMRFDGRIVPYEMSSSIEGMSL
ncbi:MAG: DUF4251 domain-containing protein [Bacteroidales bacterium]|nr:DUF4251 domain-containing protein [Bacteroidales bacterium]